MKVPKVNFHHDTKPMNNIDDIIAIDNIIKKQMSKDEEHLLSPESLTSELVSIVDITQTTTNSVKKTRDFKNSW